MSYYEIDDLVTPCCYSKEEIAAAKRKLFASFEQQYSEARRSGEYTNWEGELVTWESSGDGRWVSAHTWPTVKA